jgi:hypothetical protein
VFQQVPLESPSGLNEGAPGVIVTVVGVMVAAIDGIPKPGTLLPLGVVRAVKSRATRSLFEFSSSAQP